MLSVIVMCAAFLAASEPPAPTQPSAARIEVVLPGLPPPAPGQQGFASGRLVAYLIRKGELERASPADGPFWSNPQPLLGVDVERLAPGGRIVLDDNAPAFPARLNELPAGEYRVQAVLDRVRADSSWRREPGNLYSKEATITIGPGSQQVVQLALTEATRPQEAPKVEGVEFVEFRSALLSEFYGREVVLRAGVVWPTGVTANTAAGRKFPAVYEVPGFGGNHFSAAGVARRARSERAGEDLKALHARAFWIVLDPESENGHTLFADSQNNGPRGRALVEELIVGLEQRFPLRSDASSRIVTGHSSGGWSSLWLLLTYPRVFGACWSGAPDPVDFRAFQITDITSWPSMYTLHADVRSHGLTLKQGAESPSYQRGERTLMSVRQEAGAENVVGPRNTSAQQWASWQAVFGPRAADGRPAALFDPVTGAIDRAVAAAYAPYDISALLAKEPEKYGPLLRERVKIVVGDGDNFFLHLAVQMLKDRLDAVWPAEKSPEGKGGIVVVPGADHGSVTRSEAYRNWPKEMVEFLERSAPKSKMGE